MDWLKKTKQLPSAPQYNTVCVQAHVKKHTQIWNWMDGEVLSLSYFPSLQADDME